MCKRIFANQTSEQGDVPFFKIGTIGGTPDAYISRDLFEEYKAKYNYPRKGEVMITCAGTVGKTIVFDGEDAYFQDSNIVWLSNPKQLYINSFLNYVLSRVNWNKLNSTTITRIYNDNLRELVINYPTVKEQEKIVALLSLLDQRIAIQNKIIEDLKRLKRAINNQFHDSVTCGIKTCFADLGNSYSGLSGKAASDFGEGYPFIPYTNVFSNTVIDENDYGLVNVSKDEHQNIVERGDLIITLSSETPEEVGVGAVYMGHDKEIYLNSFCFGIHFHALDRVMPKYLAYMVESNMFRRFVYPLAQGSTRYNLQKGDFEKKLFTLPTLAEQSQIVAVLDTISSKLDLEKSILKNLTTVKASMIQGLFV